MTERSSTGSCARVGASAAHPGLVACALPRALGACHVRNVH